MVTVDAVAQQVTPVQTTDPGDLSSDVNFTVGVASDFTDPWLGILGHLQISGTRGGDWKFAEPSGSIRADSSGNGNDLSSAGDVKTVELGT